jgi:hypothetical protein
MIGLYTPLNLPVKFVPPHTVRSSASPETRWSVKDINQEFISFLYDMGITVLIGRQFNNTPNNQYRIHTDISNPFPNNGCALNFVYGGEGSRMIWYEPLAGKRFKLITHNNGYSFATFDLEDLREISDSQCVDTALVNIGVPHTMVNGPRERTCYSMVLGTADKRLLEFEQAQEKLKDFIYSA